MWLMSICAELNGGALSPFSADSFWIIQSIGSSGTQPPEAVPSTRPSSRNTRLPGVQSISDVCQDPQAAPSLKDSWPPWLAACTNALMLVSHSLSGKSTSKVWSDPAGHSRCADLYPVVIRLTRNVSVYPPNRRPIARRGTTAAEHTAPAPRNIRMCSCPPEIHSVRDVQ